MRVMVTSKFVSVLSVDRLTDNDLAFDPPSTGGVHFSLTNDRGQLPPYPRPPPGPPTV